MTIIKTKREIPYIGSKLVQRIKVEESTRHKWVKSGRLPLLSKGDNSCSQEFASLVFKNTDYLRQAEFPALSMEKVSMRREVHIFIAELFPMKVNKFTLNYTQ